MVRPGAGDLISPIEPRRLAADGAEGDHRPDLLAAALGLAAPGAVSAQQGPDSSGRVGADRAAPMALTVSPATACLQLHLGSTVFNFNMTINADVYPYPITGGTITGSICQAPWTVTGGSLGNGLVIHGQRTPVSGCATTIAVVGNFNRQATSVPTASTARVGCLTIIPCSSATTVRRVRDLVSTYI